MSSRRPLKNNGFETNFETDLGLLILLDITDVWLLMYR